MKKTVLAALFSGLLASGALFGQQDAGGSGIAPAETSSSRGFRLTGVLISDTRESAIVNGRILSTGDRVGGVELLGISMGEVRVLRGDQEFTVRIGQSLTSSQMASATAGVIRRRAQQPRAQASRFDPDEQSGRAVVRHAVEPGETLSDIALRYLGDGVTLKDMISALFRANTEAFGGDADLLFAGAMLDIPDLQRQHTPKPGIALAALADETDDLMPADKENAKGEKAVAADRYGPVRAGETLSGIVSTFLEYGVTREQMMIALLRCNPHAFKDNVNILYEGVVLRIPTESEAREVSPALAAAEILEQTDLWHSGRERHASSRANVPAIMAAAETPPR